MGIYTPERDTLPCCRTRSCSASIAIDAYTPTFNPNTVKRAPMPISVPRPQMRLYILTKVCDGLEAAEDEGGLRQHFKV